MLQSRHLQLVVLLVAGLWHSAHCLAEYYIYIGPDGQKLLSDREITRPGYRLQMERDTLKDSGHLIAGREQQIRQAHHGFFDHY